MMLALGLVGLYVLLVGLASFGEKPVAGHLDAFQFTAALRSGGLLLAVPAELAAHGLSLPSPLAALAGLGIGLISGTGAVFYCYAITRLPVWLVTSFANAYVVVTVLLGVIILHEPLGVIKVAGLVLTLGGLLLLAYHPHRGKQAGWYPGLSLVLIGAYVVVVGVATFLEKPALQHLDALQLNALSTVGTASVGIAAVLAFDHSLPRQAWTLPGTGAGAMMGLGSIFYYLGLQHLPVSVAAPLSNTYVLIPLLLSILFLHASITPFKITGILATLLGVTLLVIP